MTSRYELDTPKSVQVVSVTHNSSHLLSQLLKSVGPLAPVLTIVDSGSSTDHLLATREFCAQNSVDFFDLGRNAGFGTATNAGAARSDSEWICVVNPDVSFDAAAVLGIIERAEASASACAGPAISSADAGLEVGLRPLPTGIRRSMTKFSRRNADAESSAMTTISGCFMLLRRDAFCQVQGFDENFFMFCEEIDLHARLQQHGGLISHFADVVITTAGGGSSADTTSRWSSTERQIAHCQLYLKWLGPRAFAVDAIYRGLTIMLRERYAPRRQSLVQFATGLKRVWSLRPPVR